MIKLIRVLAVAAVLSVCGLVAAAPASASPVTTAAPLAGAVQVAEGGWQAPNEVAFRSANCADGWLCAFPPGQAAGTCDWCFYAWIFVNYGGTCVNLGIDPNGFNWNDNVVALQLH